MGWIKNTYRENIYGIIGTLVFHILLVSFFLLAEIDMKGKMKEEPVVIEFPHILLDVEELKEEQQNDPSIQGIENIKLATNRASNLSVREDDFFDEDYRNEMEAAQKLVYDVNNQLDKEVINIDDIKMPVEKTEGLDPDSIKNIIYTGESNIVYNLEDRHHLSLPIPVYLAQGGGKVIVDIVVNKRGNVIKAIVRKNSSLQDIQICFYARLAASRTVFNSDSNAPYQQKGTIQYIFIAQ